MLWSSALLHRPGAHGRHSLLRWKASECAVLAAQALGELCGQAGHVRPAAEMLRCASFKQAHLRAVEELEARLS